MAHRHRWIDTTYLGSDAEHRLRALCNREERRRIPALMSADECPEYLQWQEVSGRGGSNL